MGVFFKHENRFEIKYVFSLRKILKKLFKTKTTRRRRLWTTPKMLWFVLFPNFVLTKKSKNARMGKGKGNFLRWTIRVKGGSVLFEFKGYNVDRVNFFTNQIQKKLPMKLCIVYKQLISFFTYGKTTHKLLPKKYSM